MLDEGTMRSYRRCNGVRRGCATDSCKATKIRYRFWVMGSKFSIQYGQLLELVIIRLSIAWISIKTLPGSPRSLFPWAFGGKKKMRKKFRGLETTARESEKAASIRKEQRDKRKKGGIQ